MTSKRVLSFCLGVVVSLVVAEVLIRRFYFLQYSWLPELGYVLAPGTTTRFGREGHGTTRRVENGIRDRVVRGGVFVFGDSQVEALMLDSHDTFAAVSSRFVNVGRSGAGLADVAAMMPYYARYLPSHVVLVASENDIGDFDRAASPRFRCNSDRVELDPTRPPASDGLWWQVRNRSMLAALAAIRWVEIRGAQDEASVFFGADGAPRPLVGLPSPCWSRLADVLAIVSERAPAPFISVWLPHLQPEDERLEQEWLRAASRHGVRVVSLRAAFRDHLAAGDAPFGFFNTAFNQGHLNALGHRILRDALIHEIAVPAPEAR